MSNIATTIVQSKHLLELGLDPNTADMFWKYSASLGNTDINGRIAVSYHDNLFVGKCDGAIPAWSLSALLEVMPMNINDYDLYITKHKYVDGGYAYNIEYNRGFTISVLHKETNRNVITAAFEMVKWLLEQKILTFSGNEKDCS
jgi:hypothetical protein